MTRDALPWRRLRDTPVELACCGEGGPLERLEVVNAVFWQASVGSLKNVVLVSARAGCEPRGGYACGAGSARKRLGFRS